ncbi:MAG: hypothetical protein IJ393_06080 [Clostridia bacterium]|nr:hypothetical protein [Clostridia bacterium]MBQ7831618.1 hypothetical protein [Clostridia bacterium]
MDKFSVQLPVTGEYLTTVRLTTGGLCSLVGFDVDLAEDYKVCVTESLLILKRNGYATAAIEFTVGEALACRVVGTGACGERIEGFEDEISRALLSALLGEVKFVTDENGRVTEIGFEG